MVQTINGQTVPVAHSCSLQSYQHFYYACIFHVNLFGSFILSDYFSSVYFWSSAGKTNKIHATKNKEKNLNMFA